MGKVLSSLALVALLFPASVQAATLKVCSSGTAGAGDDTFTLAQLQAAIDAMAAGDVLLLQRGATFTGTFTLPRHGGGTYATIKTGVEADCSLSSAGVFPAANVRMDAARAATANLATLRANANNNSALKTADPVGGLSPEYWRIEWVKFASNVSTDWIGSGSAISCGSDSNTTITAYTEVPANFVFSQIYVTGDPVTGQFRGISIHCNNTTIQDSTVENIKSLTEGQALWVNSCESCGTFTNNTFSGGTEVVIAGGSSGAARPNITVLASPTPTTTTATLSGRTGLRVGKSVTFNVAGVEQQTEIVSCGTSTVGALCTSDAVTFTALTAAPDTPGDVDWGLNPSFNMTKNLVTRPLTMRNPIMGVPQAVSAVASATGGTLAAGTYYYRVVARMKVASSSSSNMASSAASNEVNATTTGSTGSVTVSWVAVANATEYRVYGRNAGGQNIYWTVTAGAGCSGTACSYTDTNASSTSGSVPTSSGTQFYVKNIFELKTCVNCTIDGNIFENSWFMTGGQYYAITLTVSNTGGTNDSTELSGLMFRNNIVRNAPGAISLCGRDCSVTAGGGEAVGRTRNITVSNNLFYNINTSWGGTSAINWLLFSTGNDAGLYAAGQALGPKDVTLEHNTIDNTTGSLINFDLFKGSLARPVENITFRNNLARKANFGIFGSNSCSQGNGCWTTYTTGTIVYAQNVIEAASCGSYPVGTICPSSGVLASTHWTDQATGNYVLRGSSSYKGAATDGGDIGANIATITALTDIAASGDNTGAPPAPPPTILTTAVSGNAVNTPISVQFQGTCPSTPCVWAYTGTLPPGTTLVSTSSTVGTWSGTFLSAGTYLFSVTLTDAGSRVATQPFVVTVTEESPGGGTPVIHRPARFGYDERFHFGRETDPAVATEEAPAEPLKATDLWGDLSCSSPVLKLLVGTSPAVQWRPMAFRPTQTISTITTAGVVTYSAAQMMGGLILRDPNGAGRSDVTATAALLLAAMPCPAIGDYFELDIRNTADAAEVITVTAGAGVTLSGTMTIAQNNTRRFKVVVTAVDTPAVTVFSVGSFVH